VNLVASIAQAAIVGVGESLEVGHVPDKTILELAAEASIAALENAGLSRADIDAVYSQSGPAPRLAEYLGIDPVCGLDSTGLGGASNAAHVAHAAAAIAAGQVQTVLIAHCGKNRSSRSETGQRPGGEGDPEWGVPFGVAAPVAGYALAARRHMYEYGITSEQLAEVAVATRAWASMNPRATMRDPITTQDVIGSRMICDPLHLLDCCLVSDAAGAVIVTSRDRVAETRNMPIWILGTGEAHDTRPIWAVPDITASSAGRASKAALRSAGVHHENIDVLELYDAFTSEVVCLLEDLGFCKKGEGGAFVENGRTAPGGELPMNTQGGALSYLHPGMFGIFTVIEAVRQLRHEYKDSPRQVKDAEIAMAHAQGGVMNYHCTLILGRSQDL
jgi:acetyl-CoA acetyltransferase